MNLNFNNRKTISATITPLFSALVSLFPEIFLSALFDSPCVDCQDIAPMSCLLLASSTRICWTLIVCSILPPPFVLILHLTAFRELPSLSLFLSLPLLSSALLFYKSAKNLFIHQFYIRWVCKEHCNWCWSKHTLACTYIGKASFYFTASHLPMQPPMGALSALL